VQAVVCAALLLSASVADAATVTSGQATISFDTEVWAEFGLTTLNGFIDASGNPLPVGPAAGVDLLDVAVGSLTSPQVYTLNPPGIDVTPTEPRRSAPPTGFSYNVATLPAGATGNIAFAGISRWTVSPDFGGGQLLFGDYALAWNASAGRWELSNYIDFPVVVFYVENVQLVKGPGDAFALSGDLIGAPLLNVLLAGALGRDFGDFTFSTLGQCANGVDDDGDGRVDLSDPGCAGAADASERGTAACDNGVDDDGDGGFDFYVDANGDLLGDAPGDLGCLSVTSNIEAPQCQDGLNNDAQLGTDWDGGLSVGADDPAGADPQCTLPTRNAEAATSPGGCGIGPELLLALPLLVSLRARRRARA
jgi:hypothetical protein